MNRSANLPPHPDSEESGPAKIALQQSDAKLRAILETAVEGIITIDKLGVIESVNSAALRIFGYQSDEVVGQNVKMLMPSPHRDEHDGYLSNYLETGQKSIIGIGREVVGRRADGTTFPMHLSVSELWLDDQWYFTGIVQDITQRKQAEEALAHSEAKLRAVLETAIEGMIVIDHAGSIESVNPAAERMFGYSAKELVDKNVDLLMPSPYREEHDGYLASYLRTGERKIIGSGRELVGRRKDGSTFPMYLSVAEVLLDGEPLFTGIVRDLTDAKNAQERLLQAERLAAIGQMVTSLSHESRNYLQRISSSAEMLEMEVEGNSDAIKDIASVLKATKSLKELLEEVRSFAAPIKLDVSTCCVASIWRRVWSALEPSWQEREIVFHEELDGVETQCAVDSFRLEQVFRNVFENSLVACDDSVRIVIHCRDSKIDAAPAFQVSIRDNGPGLTQEQRERVFDAFFTTKTKGTGLGMSIVKRLVEAHGGQIAVGDNAADGAEFVITLPR
jgi:two-component system sensor kinase FixL